MFTYDNRHATLPTSTLLYPGNAVWPLLELQKNCLPPIWSIFQALVSLCYILTIESVSLLHHDNRVCVFVTSWQQSPLLYPNNRIWCWPLIPSESHHIMYLLSILHERTEGKDDHVHEVHEYSASDASFFTDFPSDGSMGGNAVGLWKERKKERLLIGLFPFRRVILIKWWQ